MKIAACYIRVSTDDQTEISPTSQLNEIKKYAKAHDYYIPDEYIFADEGISGRTTKKRPQFQKMIQTAKSKPKPFEAVLLWKFSRFARNRSDAIVYKKLLRDECGIEVISISENIGDDPGTALILESMFEAMDEYYSINLSGEVKRSMILKAEQGKPLSIAPYGYKMVDHNLVIDEEQAKIVRYIYDQYESGAGQFSIARSLVAMGITTNRGNKPDNRYIEYILRNPTYIGKIRWSKSGRKSTTLYRHVIEDDPDLIISDGQHEPIISEDQFNKIQTMIAENKARYHKYQRKEPGKHEFALRGLVVCSNCGSTLVYSSTAEGSLQCHKYNRGQCSVSHYANLKRLNEAVATALHQAAESMNFDVLPITKPASQDDLTVLNQILTSEERKLQKVKEAYELGIDSIEEYKENKERITQSIKEVKEQIASKKQTTGINKKDYAKRILDVVKAYENPTISAKAKNEILRTIIHKIIFHRPSNEIEIIFYA